MRLRQALEDCSTALLLRVAQHHALLLPETALRPEVTAALEARLAEDGYLERFLAGLPPLQQRALQVVAGAGGEVRGYELERHVRQWTDDDEGPATPILDLLQQGLLFRTFVPSGPQRGEIYFMPSEVRSLVLPAASALPTRELLETVEPIRPPREHDPAFDLFLLASYLRRSTGQRLDQFHAELAEATTALAGVTPANHWRFMLTVARQAGAIEREGGRTLPGEAIDALLADRQEAAQRLWDGYLVSDEWSEVVESGLSPSPLLGRLRSAPDLRAHMLDLLRPLEPGRWHLVEALVASIHRQAPDVLREHYESPSASLLDPRTGQILQGPQSWSQVEVPVLRYLLYGPLCWLGITSFSVDADGRELVALTDRGAALSAGTPSPLLATTEPGQLERDGTLRFPGRGDLAAMYRLEAYVRPLKRGNPSEYQLDVASFCDGLAAGGSLDDMQHLLAAVLGAPLSARVRQTLSTWAAEFGQAAIHPAVLLTFADERLAESLLDAPSLAPRLRARLGPKAAQVAISQVGPLVRELHALGHYPSVDASLRLMAGRGAYPALVDEHALEFLLVSLEALKRLAPSALADVEHVAELRHRLRAALGSERSRRLLALARKVVKEARGAPAAGRRSPRARPGRGPSSGAPAAGELADG